MIEDLINSYSKSPLQFYSILVKSSLEVIEEFQKLIETEKGDYKKLKKGERENLNEKEKEEIIFSLLFHSRRKNKKLKSVSFKKENKLKNNYYSYNGKDKEEDEELIQETKKCTKSFKLKSSLKIKNANNKSSTKPEKMLNKNQVIKEVESESDSDSESEKESHHSISDYGIARRVFKFLHLMKYDLCSVIVGFIYFDRIIQRFYNKVEKSMLPR